MNRFRHECMITNFRGTCRRRRYGERGKVHVLKTEPVLFYVWSLLGNSFYKVIALFVVDMWRE